MSKNSKNKQLLFFFITLAITSWSIIAIKSHPISAPDPNPINDLDYLRALNTYRDDKRNIQALNSDYDHDHFIHDKSFLKMSRKADPSFHGLKSDQHHPAQNKRFLGFSPMLLSHLRFNLRNKQFLTRFKGNDAPQPFMRKIQRRQLEYEPNITNHDYNTIHLLLEPSKTDSIKQNYQRITKKSTIDPNQMSNEEHKEQQLLADYFYYKYLDKLISVVMNRNSDDPTQAIDEMTRFINQAMMTIR